VRVIRVVVMEWIGSPRELGRDDLPCDLGIGFVFMRLVCIFYVYIGHCLEFGLRRRACISYHGREELGTREGLYITSQLLDHMLHSSQDFPCWMNTPLK
jgi:hypothetical protein